MTTNQDLSEYAAQSCYGCNGTGLIDWPASRVHGAECLCVAVCGDCDEYIAWGHDDECAPELCDECRKEQN